MEKYPIVLSIAGSDSIGGAGIQADIKTCCALGVYAMTAITAITAQCTSKVHTFMAVDTQLFEAQLRAVLEDERPNAVKIGMLPNNDIIDIVNNIIDEYNLNNIVFDPVMVATSGDLLVDEMDNNISIPMKRLISKSLVITPNIPEAIHLCGFDIIDASDIEVGATKIITNFNCNSVLLKGGHMDSNELTDLFLDKRGIKKYIRNKKIITNNTHGTGCSLSSAIAANLSKGFSLYDSVEKACSFIYTAINRGKNYKFGKGFGPINHLYKIHDYDNQSK